ncbi:GTP-binding protein [Neptuniibacter sp. QD48_55]|uniref:GTP-binding protein n=1 Tax=Neptuniibacter sp. QD48_55 TaxID=3398212 RepID=UPI0039F4ECDA
MRDKKIIFFGAVGAGKTTAINTISEGKCINTEANASDSTSIQKKTTTVAMDYGYVTSSTNQRIHCYGTPGQERFQFMWEIITSNLASDYSGEILFLDNNRKYPQHDLHFYTKKFRHLIDDKPLIIAVTKSDIKPNPSISEYRGWLHELGIQAPIYFIDARKKEDILFLLEELLPDQAQVINEMNSVSVIEDELNLDEVIQYSEHKVEFSDKVLNKISHLEGVVGIALITSEGKLGHSTLDTEFLIELLEFLTSSPSTLEDQNKSDHVLSIELALEENYHFVINFFDDVVLATLCTKHLTIAALKQQIENIIQW